MAGIDANLSREMLFSLRQCGDLRNVCQGTLELLQKSTDLIYKSMTIILEERQYWRQVMDADPFHKMQVSFFHTGPMGFVSSMRRLLFNAQIYSKESAIDLKLAILRETFNKLASILGSLYRSGSLLKEISSDIENMAFTVIDVVDDVSSRNDVTSSTEGIAAKDQAYASFVQTSEKRLRWALTNLIKVHENLEDFLDVSSSFDDCESLQGGDSVRLHLNSVDLLSHATGRFDVIEVR